MEWQNPHIYTHKLFGAPSKQIDYTLDDCINGGPLYMN